MSLSPDVDLSQVPRFQLEPVSAFTDGADARFLAEGYGLTPDPWQQLVLDSWLARKADRQWAAMTCGLAVPRQNGKNGIIEMRELFGMICNGEKFLHSAHEVKTTRKAFKRLVSFFQNPNYPELAGLLSGPPREANGQEGIFLANGGSCEFIARSKNSGRGFTVDCLVMDEAQELNDDALEAVLSTTSAAPLGNPQWIFTGTPPGPQASGEVFTRIRTDGVNGTDDALSWFEWSVDDPDNLDDRDVWRRVNPALVTGRLLWDVLYSERKRFSDAGFARERLGYWAPTAAEVVISEAMWNDAADATSRITGPVVFAVSSEVDASATSISVAGLNGAGRVHVELADWQPGVTWALDRLVGMHQKHHRPTILVPSDGPAAALIPGLEAAGIKPVVVTSQHYKRACAGFLEAVKDRTLTHTGVEPKFTVAALTAGKQLSGDGWVWKKRGAVISPLDAGTLAHYGWLIQQNQPKLSTLYAF